MIGLAVVYLVWLVSSLATVGAAAQAEQVLPSLALVGGALRALGLVVLLATAVSFLSWHWTVVHNLRYLGGRQPRYSATLACVSWFLPVLNLFVPYQSLVEVLRSSGDPVKRNLKGELLPWWLLWLAAAFFGILARALMSQADSPQEWSVAGSVDGMSVACLLAAAGLAMRCVPEISARQQRRFQSFEAAALFD